ncbi:MAG: SDR family NAD(P)-dependent oxidoreductase [Candidatus Methylacidiphilales bacterium]
MNEPRNSCRVVLVTGASSGIGRAVALKLAGAGYIVWGTARDASRVPNAEGLRGVALDLLNPDSIRNAVDEVVKGSGRIDILINNAGSGILGPVLAFSDEELRGQYETLVAGPMRLIRAVRPHLPAPGGVIMNLTSIGAQFPIPFMGPYSAFKSALSLLTDAMHVECSGQGIDFIDLRPGDIHTGFNDAMARVAAPLSEDWQAKQEGAWKILEHELRTAPPPENVAECVLHLLHNKKSGRHVVGNLFQTRIGPLADRLLPRRWILCGLAAYYGLRGSRTKKSHS